MYNSVSLARDRCQQSPANIIHMFWLCSRLSSFWTEIFSAIFMVVDPNPVSALFGVFSGSPPLSYISRKFPGLHAHDWKENNMTLCSSSEQFTLIWHPLQVLARQTNFAYVPDQLPLLFIYPLVFFSLLTVILFFPEGPLCFPFLFLFPFYTHMQWK